MKAIENIIPKYICNDIGLIDSDKVAFMIYQMGLEGLGALVLLNEKLATSTTHSLHIQYLPVLASKYNTTAAKLETVVKSYGLFQIENDEIFFSDDLNKKIEIYANKLKKQIEGGRKSGETRRKSKSLNGGTCEVTSKLPRSNHEQLNKIKLNISLKDIYLIDFIEIKKRFENQLIGDFFIKNINEKEKEYEVEIATKEDVYFVVQIVLIRNLKGLQRFIHLFYETEKIPT